MPSIKKILCIVLLPFLVNYSYAQTATIPNDTINGHIIYRLAEEMPRCPYNIPSYLAENIQYPPKARRKRKQGRVVIRFIISETGDVDSPYILSGVYKELDEEALRVVSLMPRWTPGKQEGKPVKTYFTLPIQFRIE